MKPIIFSTPMVQAILDGKKTQTRRVCKALENYDFSWGLDRKPYIGDYRTFAKVAPRKWDNVTLENVWLYDLQTAVDESKTYVLKPSYKPGDILWVRETWCEYGNIHNPHMGYWHKASGVEQPHMDSVKFKMCKWRSSIHMPREAARIFLKVKEVSVERLQDITEEDARAEGFEKICFGLATPGAIQATSKELFTEHWDALNAKRGYSWHTNPWVWVVAFEKISKEEAERLEGMK